MMYKGVQKDLNSLARLRFGIDDANVFNGPYFSRSTSRSTRFIWRVDGWTVRYQCDDEGGRKMAECGGTEHG